MHQVEITQFLKYFFNKQISPNVLYKSRAFPDYLFYTADHRTAGLTSLNSPQYIESYYKIRRSL